MTYKQIQNLVKLFESNYGYDFTNEVIQQLLFVQQRDKLNYTNEEFKILLTKELKQQKFKEIEKRKRQIPIEKVVIYDKSSGME